jgi:hypothetical protein
MSKKMGSTPPVTSGITEGIHWEIRLSPLKSCGNGYVIVPESHPWFGKDYDEIEVEIHGGLTYGCHEGRVGFDTAHAWDDWSYEALAEIGGSTEYVHHYNDAENFWDLEKLTREVESLALQAANAGIA